MFLSSITSSLLITVLSATILVFFAYPGAQILFFSLYSVGMISVLVISAGKPVGPLNIRQAVFNHLVVVSSEMTGLRLCLAVLSAAFSSLADNQPVFVTSGLSALACAFVCLFQDTIALRSGRALP